MRAKSGVVLEDHSMVTFVFLGFLTFFSRSQSPTFFTCMAGESMAGIMKEYFLSYERYPQ